MSKSRTLWGALGVLVGIIFGLNIAGFMPQTPVQAVSTHGYENFAMASGPVDDAIEAVFVLDYLTGDLKGTALSPQTGRFAALFEYNVAKDLVAQGMKNPRYLMVTGLAETRRGIGRSIVYIAEATSGQMAAYAVPWFSENRVANQPQVGTFVLLDKWKFRNVPVRSTQ